MKILSAFGNHVELKFWLHVVIKNPFKQLENIVQYLLYPGQVPLRFIPSSGSWCSLCGLLWAWWSHFMGRAGGWELCFIHGFHSLYAHCDCVLFSFQLAWAFHQWEHVVKVNMRKLGNLITWEALSHRSFGEYSKHLHVKPAYHPTQPLQDWLPLTVKTLSVF